MIEILLKNNYTHVFIVKLSIKKIPIEKFKIKYFAKKNWNKIITEKSN
jgi:hypothetical protein